MSSQQLVKPAPVSGLPEWLPEVRLVELQWIDRIRLAFERYGFCSLETHSVESLEVLLAKGETSQEVYTLRRRQGDADDGDSRLRKRGFNTELHQQSDKLATQIPAR